MKLRLILLALLVLSCFFAAACGGAAEVASAELLTFSQPPGVYDKRFTLEIACADSGLTVRYTTDSSAPTAESDVYEDGIEIKYRGGGGTDPSSVNIIRCAAFDAEGNQVGDVLTGTYILSDNPEIRYSTMIVSIVCEPDDLYGYERGILVPGKVNAEFKKNRPSYWTNNSLEDANYFGSGPEWERAASVEFFSSDGTGMLAQNMGIRVSGGWNRSNAHKSLRLFARYSYDDYNTMRLDAYPGLVSTSGMPVTEHKTLILRTGSNNRNNTTIQTVFLMQLGAQAGLDTMEYRPVCVYLNGKYYGYMTLIEDYSTTYFEKNYNIPAEEITCINGAGYISGGRAWQLDNGPTSELNEFKRVINYISSHDMRDAEEYQKASEMIDIDNYIRYMCFEGYIGNSDWPQNNVRVWRRYTDGYNPDATEYGYDGRWRFLLKDLDLSGGYGADGVGASVFKRLDSDDGGLRLNAMFQSLFKNADFRNRVFCFLCDMLSDTMTIENVMEKLGEVAISAQLEMRYYIPSYNACGGSLEKWHNHLRTPYKFFKQRYTNVKNELIQKYESVWGELTVEIEGEGTVDISTLTLTEGRTLEYMVGLKLPVSGKAAEGWRLKSLTANKGTIEDGVYMMPGKSVTLTAVFEPDPDYTEPQRGLVISELLYEFAKNDASPDQVELYNDSDAAIYLKGYSLQKDGVRADGTPDTDRWTIPAVTLGAGEYLTIYYDRDGTITESGVIRAPYGLGAGDTLTLLDRMGEPLDAVTLPACTNNAVYARDAAGWYYAPTATFGAANIRAEGYRLADVLDARSFGTFMFEGKLNAELAKKTDDGYTVTEATLKELFGSDNVKKQQSRLAACRVEGGYDLDGTLAIFGYERFYIESLDSSIIMKK